MSGVKIQRLLERRRRLQQPPPLPLGFSVTSKFFGQMLVTEHAWLQFCHRYFRASNQPEEPGKYAASFFISRFQECFSRVRELPLPISQVVSRLINNGFKPARYFLDPYTHLRFVVVSGSGQEEEPRVVTVEIAYR